MRRGSLDGGVAAGPDGVWTADGVDTVAHVDPGTGKTQNLHLPGRPAAAATSGDVVWIAQRESDTVTRLAP